LPYPNDCSKYHTRQFTERALKFIEANKDRPFFLYLAHVMPHVPIFGQPRRIRRPVARRQADLFREGIASRHGYRIDLVGV
jgi:hypothetical protein